MLAVMWKGGLRGKVWRILKEMNSGLKASVKTRHGITSGIEMVIAQWSRNSQYPDIEIEKSLFMLYFQLQEISLNFADIS